MLWDIYCKVIDNFGDIGVCWRLSSDLASRGEQVRLWVDDPAALGWMAPQGQAGVDVLGWPGGDAAAEPGDVVIEAFGCDLPDAVQAAIAERARASTGKPVCWINLEYLTAESFAERAHGLASPVMSGPAAGLVKHFFFPGFTTGTGGLLLEAALVSRQAAFDPAGWLSQHGIAWHGERLMSLFCYEPAALPALLDQLANSAEPTLMLVTPGRATQAVKAAGLPHAWGALSLLPLPALSQTGYDELLWACDLNFVRGEDSLVRAMWAAKPLVWQAYPQDDGAHHAKLEAFLDVIAAPASLRQMHCSWNSAAQMSLPPLDLASWGATVRQARDALWLQDDLTTQLVRHAMKRR
ncbi:elongation factor P maturation arginine rhamnosyltransferase EarP [soil metagenome]